MPQNEGAELQILGVESTAYADVHGWAFTKRYDFDAAHGLVKAIVSESRDVGVEKVKDRFIVELVETNQHDAAWTAAFRGDAEQYEDNYAAWANQSSLADRARSWEACQTARSAARAALETGRKQAQSKIVQAIYEADLQNHDSNEAWAKANTEMRIRFFAAASRFPTDWETKNLEGGAFRLKDLRGLPVALFFWVANCEYCVFTGAELNEAAADLKGKAHVVGMFGRRDDRDWDEEQGKAKSFIERAYGGFSHVEGAEIEKLYRFKEFGLGRPVVMILDGAGAPVELQFGYAEGTGRRVRQVVDELAGRGAGQP